jgi:heme/copper-type cytochrome/quinol oxidase subunit 4
MALGSPALTTLGVGLIAASVSLVWMLHPRDREEARIMQMPGAWIVFPLLIIVCLVSGGGLIYAHIGG